MLKITVGGILHDLVVALACCEAGAAKGGFWLPAGFPPLPYRSRDARAEGVRQRTPAKGCRFTDAPERDLEFI